MLVVYVNVEFFIVCGHDITTHCCLEMTSSQFYKKMCICYGDGDTVCSSDVCSDDGG